MTPPQDHIVINMGGVERIIYGIVHGDMVGKDVSNADNQMTPPQGSGGAHMKTVGRVIYGNAHGDIVGGDSSTGDMVMGDKFRNGKNNGLTSPHGQTRTNMGNVQNIVIGHVFGNHSGGDPVNGDKDDSVTSSPDYTMIRTRGCTMMNTGDATRRVHENTFVGDEVCGNNEGQK
ncbi:hypothetical protein BO78DRAFT_427198 [Aspergillus sclerotiicarbonarius CBS 121057]|uniref:Uncharacterized protein n=1 Tax=Aspergillus sclerotiicarbonarius (strain CBS 121057 / IBT 28362) TaxID=1448318 RepID=A0A319EHQ3_ASPSB|nr:hypothetical protein BO78DRAFT_427198 [Aspergillus sclerotiicarbonarius CBS 121057]